MELDSYVFLLDIKARFVPGLLGWSRLVPASFKRWRGVQSSPTSSRCPWVGNFRSHGNPPLSWVLLSGVRPICLSLYSNSKHIILDTSD